MSKKNYVRFAKILRETKADVQTPQQVEIFSQLVKQLVTYFKEDNSAFDESRFMRAILHE